MGGLVCAVVVVLCVSVVEIELVCVTLIVGVDSGMVLDTRHGASAVVPNSIRYTDEFFR